MQTLVVGLGRAGAGLHLPVLARARSAARPLFSSLPIVACDPRRTIPESPEVTVTSTVEQAERLVVPADTVVHVCTPPTVRTSVLTELAELGFRRFIVEKPLATDTDELARVVRLRRKHSLHLEVVEPWLTSTLTQRLTDLAGSGTLGDLKSIAIVQNKPRFRRSLLTPGHPSAFDVELPHGVGVALRLAGNARVTHAAGQDLVLGELVIPRMGSAAVGLRHNSGVRTLIESDLTAPVRERRITCEFSRGRAVGHYAVSDDDDHSQLTVTQNGQSTHSVQRDDSLTAWMIRAYRNFHAAPVSPAAGWTSPARSCGSCRWPRTSAPSRSPANRSHNMPAEAAEPVFTGLTDEAATSLPGQIAAAQGLGWDTIELRTVDGLALADLSDARFAEVASALARAGLGVVCVASRIGGWARPVTGAFEPDLTEFDVLAKRCALVGTRYVRIMSYPNAGRPEREWAGTVLRRVAVLAERAEKAGLVLLHENCAGWAAERADRTLELLHAVGSPALKLLFDTGNGVPHGYSAPALLAEIAPHVAHVHVKDAAGTPQRHEYTLPGRGDAGVPACVRILREHGYAGGWSAEPHLSIRPHESGRLAGNAAETFARAGAAMRDVVTAAWAAR